MTNSKHVRNAGLANSREKSRDGRAGGNVIALDRRSCRQPARQTTRRAAGSALVHWAAGYQPQTSTAYDEAIRQTWALCDAGVIGRAEAEARDVALRRLRYALGEGREGRP